MRHATKNRAIESQQPPGLNDPNSNCAVFIAHFSDGYRVIYHMNGEWLLDALEQTLTHARLKAERCIEAMLASKKCPRFSAEIYEVTITADLDEDMKHGLRDAHSDWQYYMTHAAAMLNELSHVHTVSFIADNGRNDQDQQRVPYLFVVSSEAFGNQHHIHTVRLRTSRPSLKTGIIHEVSEGKALWHSGNSLYEEKVSSPVAMKGRNQSLLQSIMLRAQEIFQPIKAGSGF